MIGNLDDETNFPHKLLLTNKQDANICRAFAKHTSTDIKLSKTQLSKMVKSGGFLGRLLGPLLKTGLPSNNEMKDILKTVKSLEDSELLQKGVSETIKTKQKNKKEDFLVCY